MPGTAAGAAALRELIAEGVAGLREGGLNRFARLSCLRNPTALLTVPF